MAVILICQQPADAPDTTWGSLGSVFNIETALEKVEQLSKFDAEAGQKYNYGLVLWSDQPYAVDKPITNDMVNLFVGNTKIHKPRGGINVSLDKAIAFANDQARESGTTWYVYHIKDGAYTALNTLEPNWYGKLCRYIQPSE